MRKVKKGSVSSVLFLLFQLSIITSFAQTTGTIKGTVKDAGGQPLRLHLYKYKDQEAEQLSDNSGNCSLASQPENSYII
jgi:hypothetical protein